MKRLSLLALLLIAACAPGAYQSSPDVTATVNGSEAYRGDAYSVGAFVTSDGLGFSVSNYSDAPLVFDLAGSSLTYSDGTTEDVSLRRELSAQQPTDVAIIQEGDAGALVIVLPDSSVSRSPMWGTRIVPPFVGAQPGSTATLDLVIAANGEPETVTVVYTVR